MEDNTINDNNLEFENRIDLSELQESVFNIKNQLGKVIVGQKNMIDLLVVAILSNGHALIEGVPGVAKTITAKLLSRTMSVDFSRIQFTPDLMPSDILGTSVFNVKTSEFEFKKGPIFSNMILIDEINRAPAKTQAALFEVMEEQQITIDGDTYKMDQPFIVLATQNPIEQEGTYPLPEAQLDRFLMHVELDFPSREAELQILRLVRGELKSPEPVNLQIDKNTVLSAREEILDLYVAEAIEEYMVQLTLATRQNSSGKPWANELEAWLTCGVSPRATLALERCARAAAWLSGRDFVTPDDVQAVFANVYRHRLYLSYEAQAQGITANQVVDTLLANVPVA